MAADTLSRYFTLCHNRKTILATKHWRDIAELRAELTATNRELRAVRKSLQASDIHPPAKDERSRPQPVKPESGDHVTVENWGEGIIVSTEWSSKLGCVLYRGRFADGFHYFDVGAIQKLEKGTRDNG